VVNQKGETMLLLLLCGLICFYGEIYCRVEQIFQPKVSIITSVFKGDAYIEQFMEEIVKQTIFDQCELIMINANSPGNEESVIASYMESYPNIVYMKLDKDPGLYGVWNIAIKMAHGEYIINANLDDGLAYDALEKFAKTLDEDSNIDLVYSDFYVTKKPHQNFYDLNGKNSVITDTEEFSYYNLRKSFYCMTNNHPMWRKSIHEKYGYFDESYIAAGDCDMCARMALGGSQFKRVPGILGFWYVNPIGLSQKDHMGPREIKRIMELYPESLSDKL
jgi:GT2 family glycosyltransferase